MKAFVAALAAALSISFQAAAGTAMIEPASPLAPAPLGAVQREGLQPVPGIAVAPPRAPAAYAPEWTARRPASPSVVPVPEPNRLAVSWCQMDLGKRN